MSFECWACRHVPPCLTKKDPTLPTARERARVVICVAREPQGPSPTETFSLGQDLQIRRKWHRNPGFPPSPARALAFNRERRGDSPTSTSIPVRHQIAHLATHMLKQKEMHVWKGTIEESHSPRSKGLNPSESSPCCGFRHNMLEATSRQQFGHAGTDNC